MIYKNKNLCPVCDFDITDDVYNNGHCDKNDQFWCWSHSSMEQDDINYHALVDPDLKAYFKSKGML